jgi:hypothetical protein
MAKAKRESRRYRAALQVLPLSWEAVNEIIDPKLSSGEWWALTGVSPQMLDVLTVLEAAHYEGSAKLDLQVIAGLDGPFGLIGMTILARKSRMSAAELAAVLSRAGAPVSFELLESRDIIFLASEEERSWLMEHGLCGVPLLLASSLAPAGEAAPEEPDKSRGMYSRLLSVQRLLFGPLSGGAR